MPVTEVLICTTCRPAQAARDAPPAGQSLLEAVLDAVRRSAQAGQETRFGPGPGPLVRGIACMSGCSRACTVAFQAPGKPTYFFGDLQADSITAEHVLACAVMHQQSADGLLPRKERPERLRQGILAKLPPLADALRLAP